VEKRQPEIDASPLRRSKNDVCDIVGQRPSVEIRAGIFSNSLQYQ
jgi:hypothetical protein